MTPRNAFQDFMAAIDRRDAPAVVALLDPADYGRWREQQLFGLAVDLADRHPAPPRREVAATEMFSYDSSELPFLLAQYGEHRVPHLAGQPTLADLADWEPRLLLEQVLSAGFRQAVGHTERARPPLTIVGEVLETDDLAHLLCRAADATSRGIADAEVFTVRRVDGAWRLCMCNALHLVIHF